jgi:hypothetical protein
VRSTQAGTDDLVLPVRLTDLYSLLRARSQAG